jgi:hypothetical protein
MKNSHAWNVTHNKEGATIWNLKPEFTIVSREVVMVVVVIYPSIWFLVVSQYNYSDDSINLLDLLCSNFA